MLYENINNKFSYSAEESIKKELEEKIRKINIAKRLLWTNKFSKKKSQPEMERQPTRVESPTVKMRLIPDSMQIFNPDNMISISPTKRKLFKESIKELEFTKMSLLRLEQQHQTSTRLSDKRQESSMLNTLRNTLNLSENKVVSPHVSIVYLYYV